MHCAAPDCVANCPVKALTKTEYGPVLYNAKTCIGCQTCVRVCPFHVPQFDAEIKKIVKCSMCAHKTSEGKQPSCVEVCPTGALQFGEYADILAKAKATAAKGKMKIYGLKENGGTSLFVLAKTDPVMAGYPKVGPKKIKGSASLGELVTAPAIVALAVGGFTKFAERKDRIRAEEEAKKSEK
jgi:formate dehydrogenase iron-sulfur subunit